MIITTTGLKVALATGLGSLVIGGAAAAATGASSGRTHAIPATTSASDSVTASASADPSGTDPSGTPSTDQSGGGPRASASASTSWTPTTGPDPLGPAGWGLCHGFGNKTWGHAPQATGTPDPAGRKPGNPSVAYANLLAAAASQGMTVDQFCTQVLAGGTPTTNAVSPTAGVADGTGAHGNSHGRGTGRGSGHSKAGHSHGHGTG